MSTPSADNLVVWRDPAHADLHRPPAEWAFYKRAFPVPYRSGYRQTREDDACDAACRNTGRPRRFPLRATLRPSSVEIVLSIGPVSVQISIQPLARSNVAAPRRFIAEGIVPECGTNSPRARRKYLCPPHSHLIVLRHGNALNSWRKFFPRAPKHRSLDPSKNRALDSKNAP